MEAVGISRELQAKLTELVAGVNTYEKTKRISWKSIRDLLEDVRKPNRDLPTLNRLFGPTVFTELEALFNIIL